MKLTISLTKLGHLKSFIEKHAVILLIGILSITSICFFFNYFNSGLALAYNDARSHLDIGRRVVEGLKPGLAQLGSVWLPLNHILMIPLIWNDWMWHTGLAGAVWSMLSFIGTGLIIYKYLERIKVGLLGRLIGVFIFASNLNILYLQSTAMTELLLIFTMTTGCFYLLKYLQEDKTLDFISCSFWIMLSTLVRYDGWFLLAISTLILLGHIFRKNGYSAMEGLTIQFLTIAAFGLVLWFGWNLVIFKDPLYFALGPFSAHSQQQQLLDAGNLPTKNNPLLSSQIYLYALFYNSIATTALIGFFSLIILWFDRRQSSASKLGAVALLSPLFFNILALILGFSVLFIQGISGDTWFNVRYGVMLMPAIAIFIGYLIDRAQNLRWVIIGLLLFTTLFAYTSGDSVTIDDARVGSSQKNVTEVSGWLEANTSKKPGYILISAASHDAIIFSSHLPMSKFIHEGTGAYWESATTVPDQWARWIVMRTNDINDQTFRLVSKTKGYSHYNLVNHYPFADIYELQPEYIQYLHTSPVFSNQK